jgi:hypothetical protein
MSDSKVSNEKSSEVEQEANKNIFGSDQKGFYNPFALPKAPTSGPPQNEFLEQSRSFN